MRDDADWSFVVGSTPPMKVTPMKVTPASRPRGRDLPGHSDLW
jgi:hypothetical protein